MKPLNLFLLLFLIISLPNCRDKDANNLLEPEPPEDMIGEVYSVNNSPIPANKVHTVSVDKDDKVWIGVSDQPNKKEYLVNYDGENWDVQEFNWPIVRSIVFDSENTVWLGTGGLKNQRVLLNYDNEQWIEYNNENSGLAEIGDYWINSVAIDSFNNVWIGTTRGLVFYNRDEWKVFNTENSTLNNDAIYDLAFDSNNNLWITTGGGSITFFNYQDFIFYDFSDYGVNNHGSQNLVIDSKDHKWITPSYMGIARFDVSSLLVLNKENAGLPGNVFESLTVDRDDGIWSAYIGKQPTGEGAALIHLNSNQKLTLFTTENSDLPHPTVYDIATDSHRNVWIGTEKGLFLIKANEL